MNDLPIISIHAPRTGSDVRRKDGVTYDVLISIHAPRTGSDVTDVDMQIILDISIHAPRTGSDSPDGRCTDYPFRRFQSTLPARGATSSCKGLHAQKLFQSTLPAGVATISIALTAVVRIFQSTLPARGATETVVVPFSA